MKTPITENGIQPEPRRRWNIKQWNVKRLMMAVGIEIAAPVIIGVTALYLLEAGAASLRNASRCCLGGF